MLDAININISALHTQSMEHRQRGFQIMPTVSLDKLEDAMEWASSDLMDNEAYICRQTGKIYWIAGDPGMIDEEEIAEDIHENDTQSIH